MENSPKKNFLSFQIDPAKFAPATDEEKAQQLTQQLTAINTLVQQELNRRQQKGTI